MFYVYQNNDSISYKFEIKITNHFHALKLSQVVGLGRKRFVAVNLTEAAI